ncbi:hypothetical protein OAE25_02735 [Verrucomicrobiales bacterium]|nr:hypothetical protein [Verrucomicrobiales bacterium]
MKIKSIFKTPRFIIIAIGAIIGLGILDRATEKKVEVPLTGIPASEIPEAPEWAVSQPDDIDGKAIQIQIRFIELPDGSTDIAKEMTPGESAAFMKKIAEQKGVDILSAPSLHTRDSLSSSIEVGRKLDLKRRDSNKVEEIEVGVTSHMRPVISKDTESIDLDVFAQVVELSGFHGSEESSESARFDCRTISESTNIKLGNTAILGGIIREEKVLVSDKAPLIGDIPFLGRLFRSATVDSQPRKLLMTVTPTLIADEKF